MSHTKGPWVAGGTSSVVGIPIMAQPDKTKNTMVLASVFINPSIAEAEANARLIVTALDGLRLAEMVVKYFGDGPIDPLLDCDIALRDAAQAIIAKVEGRTA